MVHVPNVLRLENLACNLVLKCQASYADLGKRFQPGCLVNTPIDIQIILSFSTSALSPSSPLVILIFWLRDLQSECSFLPQVLIHSHSNVTAPLRVAQTHFTFCQHQVLSRALFGIWDRDNTRVVLSQGFIRYSWRSLTFGVLALLINSMLHVLS